ncbi:MAG: hypothetical protein ACK4M7_07165, partial [Burkholderiales bacterium]
MKLSAHYATLLISLGTLALGLALYTQEVASLIFFLSGIIGLIVGGVCAIRQGFKAITEDVTQAMIDQANSLNATQSKKTTTSKPTMIKPIKWF